MVLWFSVPQVGFEGREREGIDSVYVLVHVFDNNYWHTGDPLKKDSAREYAGWVSSNIIIHLHNTIIIISIESDALCC